MPYEKELETALDAARIAGGAILADYESFVAIPDAPASISTETDRRSQELILQHIRSVFPDDALCAEEATPTLQAAKRRGDRIWVVDPIDGTRGFAMKNGEFSVMIGLVIGGKVVVGVVLEPVAARTTYAAAAGGCWVKVGDAAPVRSRVTSESELSNAALVQSHSKGPREPSKPVKVLGPARVLEMYSAGVKLALVARGEADLYVNTYPNFRDWDICAGHLLVTEAGGTVTTLRGGETAYGKADFSQRGGLLASNGKVHAEAVRRLIDGGLA